MSSENAPIRPLGIKNGSDFLGVIPARAGSKGIPHKNVRDFAGRPLIHWTIEAALASELLDAVVISTESPEILAVALDCAPVDSITRPDELSGDEVPGVEPVIHAVVSRPTYRNVVVLQPTSPLRRPAEIDEAITLFVNAKMKSLATASTIGKPLEWLFEKREDGKFVPLRPWAGVTLRQQCQSLAALNGSIYIAEREWLLRNRALVTGDTFLFETDAATSIDLDEEIDWIVGEASVRSALGRQEMWSRES